MSAHVAILCGGLSPEREVSLVSGRAVAVALAAEGFQTTLIDAKRNVWTDLQRANPDIIFNALHGVWGEDGRIQGLLDLFGRPYTHSGVLASALAMDKHRSKVYLREAGITVSDGLLVDRKSAALSHPLPPPYVVKPNAQGSSVGVYIVKEGANGPPAEIADNDDMGELVLAETFAPGRELTTAVMDGKALCVTEIVPRTAFYDYEAKYSEGGSDHIVPAIIPPAVEELCMEWAVRAHEVFGCKGLTRSDFRFDDRNIKKNAAKSDVVNKLVMLEINTQPGLTPTSLAPEQAQHCGISFNQLCRWMVEDAAWPRE